MKKVIILVLCSLIFLTGCTKEKVDNTTSIVKPIEIETIQVENIETETILYEDVTTYWD